MPREKETYRRVVPRVWTDPDTKRALSRDEKLFLVYLFTNPHSLPCGLYQLPLVFVQDELGFSPEEALPMLQGPLAEFASYDPATEEVLVHRMAEHQVGPLHGKDKRISWFEKQLELAHSPTLLRKFQELYPEWNLDYDRLVPDVENSDSDEKWPPDPSFGDRSVSQNDTTAEDGSTTRKEKGHTKGHGKGHTKPHGKPVPVPVPVPVPRPSPRTTTTRGIHQPPKAESGGHAREPAGEVGMNPEDLWTADRLQEARAAIVEHLHLGEDEVTVHGHTVGLGLELKRWKGLALVGARRNLFSPEELTGAITVVREEARADDPDGVGLGDEPATMGLFAGDGQWHLLERCLNRWRKKQPTNDVVDTGNRSTVG